MTTKHYQIDEKAYQKLRDALDAASESLAEVEAFVNNDLVEVVFTPVEGMSTFQERVESFTMTAQDWQLYSTEPNVEQVADDLNRALKGIQQVANGPTQARDMMYLVMDEFVDFGARDTEPEVALVDALEILYDVKGLTR